MFRSTPKIIRNKTPPTKNVSLIKSKNTNHAGIENDGELTKDKTAKTEIKSNLSANGSRHLPNFVHSFKSRARYPSRISVKAAIIKKAKENNHIFWEIP